MAPKNIWAAPFNPPDGMYNAPAIKANKIKIKFAYNSQRYFFDATNTNPLGPVETLTSCAAATQNKTDCPPWYDSGNRLNIQGLTDNTTKNKKEDIIH